MTDIILIGIAGAAFHFLSYRAEVTRWLWSRYPAFLNKFLGCCACSGFWVGGALGWFYRSQGREVLGFEGWLLLPACAIVALVASPPVSYIQIYALQSMGLGQDGTEKIRD